MYIFYIKASFYSATDVDEYITAESVDYDPISDDELDALIEEPDDTLIKPTVDNEKSSRHCYMFE